MASFWKRLVAQINPFDHGATYKNPTPQPVQRVQQTQYQQPQQNQLRAKQQNRPSISINQLHSALRTLNDVTSKVYDQVNPFDNNRTFTQRTPTQNKNLVQQGGQLGGQLARSTIGGTARLANTAAAQVPQVYYTAAMLAADKTKNAEAWRNANRNALLANEMFTRGHGGLLNVGTLYDANDAARGDLKTGIRKVGGGTLESMLEAASLMTGGATGKEIAQQGLKSQLPKIGVNAGLNASQGGVYSYNQGASGKDALKNALLSAGIGTVTDVGLGLASAGASTGIKKALNSKQAQKLIKSQSGSTPVGGPFVAPGLKIKDADGAYVPKKGFVINNPDQAVTTRQIGKLKVTHPADQLTELPSGFKVNDPNNFLPLKVKNNTGSPLLGENLSGAAQQSYLSKARKAIKKLGKNEDGFIQIPGGKKSTLNDEQLLTLNHLDNLPAKKGSALSGEGLSTKSDPVALARVKALQKKLKDMGEGGYVKNPFADETPANSPRNQTGRKSARAVENQTTNPDLGTSPQQQPKATRAKTDPLESLKQEARKYKSAEEFVNSREKLYHGSNATIDQLRPSGAKGNYGETQIPGIYTTPDAEFASWFAQNKGVEVNSPKELYATLRNPLEADNIKDLAKKLGVDSNDTQKIADVAKERGYDGVILNKQTSYKNGSVREVIPFDNTGLVSRQQLTDLYNQATKKQGGLRTLMRDEGGGYDGGRSASERLNAKNRPKDIKTRTIRTAEGKNEYVAQLGDKVTDRVGRETGFKATETSPNFKTEGEMQKWISKNIALKESQPTAPKTDPQAVSGIKDQSFSSNQSLQSNIQQIESAYRGGKVKEGNLKVRLRNNENLSPEIRGMVDGTYVVKSNKQTIQDAKNLIRSDVKAAEARARNPQNAVDMQINAELFNHYVESGQSVKANDLMQQMNETNLGQMVQILSQYDKTTPSGIVRFAQNTIKRYNQTAPDSKKLSVSKDQISALVKKAQDIQKMPEGKERNIASQKLVDSVNELIPSSFADKAMAIWKAGLLTSPRTTMRNVVGNTIHEGTETIKDIPAALVDKALSLRTGKRTLTATARGLGSGAKEGTIIGKDIMKHGFDPAEAMDKFDYKRVNWGKNPVEQGFNKYTNTVFNWLGAQDKPFVQAAYNRSLYDQAKAAAINAGKRGDKNFIEDLVKNPTTTMMKIAKEDSDLATFKNRNILGKLASGAKGELSKTQAGTVAGEFVAPFTGVPTSIAGQLIDYSPIGLAKGLAKGGKVLASNVPDLQRKASQEIGRGVVGSGLMGLAAYLTQTGQMTGQPKDAEERKQWELEGKQPNSIMIGGKWRSINSIGPEALVVLAGSKFKSAENNAQAVGNIGKDFLSQTFLKGVQDPLNAITDPARYGKSYVNSAVSSTIPNLVKDVSKAFDSTARETNGVGDVLKSSIPGLRNTLLPRRDVLGNAVAQEPTGLNAFVDLFNSKTPIKNTVVDELSRLQKAGQSATPSDINKKTSIGGVDVEFTPEQRNKLLESTGQRTQSGYDTFIKTPQYSSLTDEQRKKVLEDYRSDIYLVNKMSLAAQEQLGPFSPTSTKEVKKLTARQQKVLEGTETIDDYIPKESTKSFKTKTSKTKKSKKSSGKKGGKAKVATAKLPAIPRLSLGKSPGTIKVSMKRAKAQFKTPPGVSRPTTRVRLKV